MRLDTPRRSATRAAPKPREHLWTLVKAGRRTDASLLFHGVSYGWETQLLEGGDLVYGQRFPLKAGAISRSDRASPRRCQRTVKISQVLKAG